MNKIDAEDYWKTFKTFDSIWFVLIEVYCVIVMSVGIFLNSMVIFYLYRMKKMYNSKRILVFNLALSDLLKALFMIPLKLISSMSEKWIFGRLVCHVYGFSGALFGFSSITIMAFITIERYLAIKNPIESRINRSRTIYYLIAFAWIYAIVCASSQFLTQNGYILEGMLTSCSFDYISRDVVSRSVILFMFVAGFLLPFMVIVIFYSRLYKKFKQNEKVFYYHFKRTGGESHGRSISVRQTLSQNSAEMVSLARFNSKKQLNSDGSFVIVNPDGLRKTIKQKDIQVMRTILMCLVAFCFAWFPYAALVLYAQFGSNISNYVTPLSASLPSLFTKLSIVINPIVYTFGVKNFKESLKKAFNKT